MKNRKSPGEDIITEMFKCGGDVLLKNLKILFKRCLEEGKIPVEWQNTEVIILFKKRNIENYRPISLLYVYKVLSRIISNQLTIKLNFCKGFSIKTTYQED